MKSKKVRGQKRKLNNLLKDIDGITPAFGIHKLLFFMMNNTIIISSTEMINIRYGFLLKTIFLRVQGA